MTSLLNTLGHGDVQAWLLTRDLSEFILVLQLGYVLMFVA